MLMSDGVGVSGGGALGFCLAGVTGAGFLNGDVSMDAVFDFLGVGFLDVDARRLRDGASL